MTQRGNFQNSIRPNRDQEVVGEDKRRVPPPQAMADSSRPQDIIQLDVEEDKQEPSTVQQYSTLDAILGTDGAQKLRTFTQKLHDVENRLEQEYLEDMTDPNLGLEAHEQSGGSIIQGRQSNNNLNNSQSQLRKADSSSGAEEADYRQSFCENLTVGQRFAEQNNNNYSSSNLNSQPVAKKIQAAPSTAASETQQNPSKVVSLAKERGGVGQITLKTTAPQSRNHQTLNTKNTRGTTSGLIQTMPSSYAAQGVKQSLMARMKSQESIPQYATNRPGGKTSEHHLTSRHTTTAEPKKFPEQKRQQQNMAFQRSMATLQSQPSQKDNINSIVANRLSMSSARGKPPLNTVTLGKKKSQQQKTPSGFNEILSPTNAQNQRNLQPSNFEEAQTPLEINRGRLIHQTPRSVNRKSPNQDVVEDNLALPQKWQPQQQVQQYKYQSTSGKINQQNKQQRYQEEQKQAKGNNPAVEGGIDHDESKEFLTNQRPLLDMQSAAMQLPGQQSRNHNVSNRQMHPATQQLQNNDEANTATKNTNINNTNRSYLDMALDFFSLAPRGAQTTIDDAEEVGVNTAPYIDHHYLTAMSEVYLDNGSETEEIEDLRTIKRGTNFPPKGKKGSKKRQSKLAANHQNYHTTTNFKRHKSHANMGEIQFDASGQRKKESGSDELDVDEQVVNKAPITQSHGIRSFKKPTSSSHSSQYHQENKLIISAYSKSKNEGDNNAVISGENAAVDDHDSVYTGKSFYDCPTQQEETKKQINFSGQQHQQRFLIRGGVKTPIRQLNKKIKDVDSGLTTKGKNPTGPQSCGGGVFNFIPHQQKSQDQQISGLPATTRPTTNINKSMDKGRSDHHNMVNMVESGFLMNGNSKMQKVTKFQNQKHQNYQQQKTKQKKSTQSKMKAEVVSQSKGNNNPNDQTKLSMYSQDDSQTNLLYQQQQEDSSDMPMRAATNYLGTTADRTMSNALGSHKQQLSSSDGGIMKLQGLSSTQAPANLTTRDRKISDIVSQQNDDSSFMPFEQGTSNQMTPQLIRPIPKPSIGAQESFIDGCADSWKKGGKALTVVGNRKQRYAISDAADFNQLQQNQNLNQQQIIAKMESFEHLTVDDYLKSGSDTSDSQDDLQQLGPQGAQQEKQQDYEHDKDSQLIVKSQRGHGNVTSRKLNFDVQGGAAQINNNSYGGSRSTKNQRVTSRTADAQTAAVQPEVNDVDKEGGSNWYNYMSRFTQYVNTTIQQNPQKSPQQQNNQNLSSITDLCIGFPDNQAPPSNMQQQHPMPPSFRKSPSNQTFHPRSTKIQRPMTLLETNPLRHGLTTAPKRINNIDVANSCTSSQREQLEMLARNQLHNNFSQDGGAVGRMTQGTDLVNMAASDASSMNAGGRIQDQNNGGSFVRKTKTLSNCNCQLDSYDGQFLLCRYAKEWLSLIENKTDQEVNYQQSLNLYERVQRKARNQGDELQISKDIPRTIPEEPFFSNPESEGRPVLTTILNTLSKHSSSAGYLQGLNYIVASLYFHCGEVLAFELTIRLLNDYHLKAVHMSKLPGLYNHCEIIGALVQEEMPDLFAHFKERKVEISILCQNWVITLFTQVIPLNQVQRFFALFWRDSWLVIYRLILCIFENHKNALCREQDLTSLQLLLKNSFAMRASQKMLNHNDQKENEAFWAKLLLTLEIGSRIEHGGESDEAGGLSNTIVSFEHITEEYLLKLKKKHRIF